MDNSGSSVPSWLLALLAVVFAILTIYLVFGAPLHPASTIPLLLENTVLGVIALLIINHFGKSAGLHIGINWISVIVSAVLGLAGVGLLIILDLLGVHI